MSSIMLSVLSLWAKLPRPILQLLGSALGSLHHFANTRPAQVTAANLAVCGQDADLRHESLRETGKTLLETPAIWLGTQDRLEDWFGEIRGESLLRESVQSDRGLMVLLPHLGNWELFNVFYRRYGRMTALYRPPRKAALDDVMRRVRGRHGNEMVPTDRRGIRRLYQVLESGGTVVVLPDQVPANGQFVTFFGTAALTDELAVRLQKKTAARALMLSFLRRRDGRFDTHILDPGESLYKGDRMSALTTLNSTVEELVQLAPAQYQWEYKRFRERPKGAEKIYRFNKPAGYHD